VFKSFFMGGFECSDHINRSGVRINLLDETEHSQRAYQDYKLLASKGIFTVREGICWSKVERAPRLYDFSEVVNRIKAADKYGIQQIWDLCHFGYPDDLIPTHPLFKDRFVALCIAFARMFKKYSGQQLYIVPINEISFLSWHSGDVRGTVPFAINSGFDIKYHLCKAAIAGIIALKDISPECRIITVEPLVKVHPDQAGCDPKKIEAANEDQFQAMDMIAGKICPELGGRPEFLEILGFNYYHNNQWILGGEPLPWPEDAKCRVTLSELLKLGYKRYHKPLLLSETGHYGSHRSQWLREITLQCIKALKEGVDLNGICIYPLIDRPDWDDLSSYCKCGIWDLDENKNRVEDIAYLDTFFECRKQVEEYFGNQKRAMAS
jgi:beta-glucosidase/6-phospho-beta-glucosidase/beta-galactosidase